MSNAYKRGVAVKATVAPRVAAEIEALLATGLFGRSFAGVVQELIYRSLRDPQVRYFVEGKARRT